MSYIKVKSGPHIGDFVTLKNDHSDTNSEFKAGKEVQIVGFGVMGFDIIDRFGNKLIGCGWKL